MKTAQFFILSSRNLVASPAHAGIFELEDIIENLCCAELLCPEAKASYRYSISHKGLPSKMARGVGKVFNNFHPIENIETRSENLNVLLIVAQSPNELRKVESVPKWRQRFDLVIAYVFDAWLPGAFPSSIEHFDHLFIPNIEFRSLVEKTAKIPVTVLPLAADVLSFGAGQRPRPIDVMSYGRTPENYQLKLHQELNENSDLLYYHQVSERKQTSPSLTYCSSRFDYLHRLQFRKILQRSKLTLAFDFNYTKSQSSLDPSMKLHPSYKCNHSLLTRRWFENIGAGTVVVGTRPQSKMCDEYIGWKDSTVELPDDPALGIDLIRSLLHDQERLNIISQRNYAKSLELNDWRHRIHSILTALDVPIPAGLEQTISQMQEKAHLLNLTLAS